MNNVIEINNLAYSYDNKNNVLENLNLELEKGKIITLLGENGSGKSTILKILSGNIKIQKGVVKIFDKEINKYNRKNLAQTLSFVYQKNIVPEELTVREVVSYGRLPHKNIFFKNNNKDEQCINFALKSMELLEIADKKVSTLSGGQLQRVFIALSLAQDTEILILDEPTTYLDFKYQKKIMELLKKINKEKNLTIFMILHDINQAMKYSDFIYILKDGKIINDGDKIKLLNSEVLKQTFDTEIVVTENNVIVTW